MSKEHKICQICNKKINSIYLDLYTCKCSNIYCSGHIQDHKCNYDYKSQYMKILKDQLVKIDSNKFERI
jgi:hypothetical protein